MIGMNSVKSKYFQEVMFEDFTIALQAKDGLLYIFELKDAEKFLKNYPKDDEGWYFNTSKDRLCAEYQGDNEVSINPSIVARHLGLPVIY